MSNSRNRLAAAVSADIDGRRFYSRDGDDIRVTHPGGWVAIVGEEPRTLPMPLHRAAIKNGCQILEPGESLSAAQRTTVEENDPGTDAFTRKNAIKAAMLDALQADEDDANEVDVRDTPRPLVGVDPEMSLRITRVRVVSASGRAHLRGGYRLARKRVRSRNDCR